MSGLRITTPTGDTALEHWRYVHNEIVPPDALSPEQVRDRSVRHHLEVAYLGDVPVGCTTVRPPAAVAAAAAADGLAPPARPTATVIARVLPAHRGRGFGTELYARGLATARELGAEAVETVVLASNPEGLRFAGARGFVEFDRYVLPGDTVAYVELRLAGLTPLTPPAGSPAPR
ncbi:GNAT family N-acetyltransferase [Streptomyces sp. NRRL S-87]|uniref:GNAT family N-acetyltransferase n=1 Tax=Streptomyces sp. NRRL S-87 TaxID=1463920 RepID=UPI000689A6D1|nr:GNAT family N-acetyltransferase [Streptomyces sp. NRRL S-87]